MSILVITLQALAFRRRGLAYDGKNYTFNYVMQEYNPYVRQMTIKAPNNVYDSYIFQHTERKIFNLSIYGDFGGSSKTGLIWNNRKVRMFDVLLEMKQNPYTVFAICGRSLYIYVYSSFFDVGQAIINVSTAKLTSITTSSLIGKYLIINKQPLPFFIHGNAIYTHYRSLPTNQITEFIEPCSKCVYCSTGNGCAECKDGTAYNEEQQQCTCVYRNQVYSVISQQCKGPSVQADDYISLPLSNTSYVFLCKNHISLKVAISKQSSSAPVKRKIYTFLNDRCGLNNIQLDESIYTYTDTIAASQLVGLTGTMTKNVSDLNLAIELQNTGIKGDIASMMFTSGDENKRFSISNILLSGRLQESGTNRNYSEDYHLNGMFNNLKNINLTLNNITISSVKIGSYWDSTYSSFGIGIAINCTIIAKFIYFGDNSSNQVTNPLTTIDFDNAEQPNTDCSTKMNSDIIQAYYLMQQLPQQMIYGTKLELACDGGPKQAGFIGKTIDSDLSISDSAISFVDTNTYSTSIGLGILIDEVQNTKIESKLCYFSVESRLYGPIGVIGKTLDSFNTIKLLGVAVNMSSTQQQSGVVGLMTGGSLTVSLYLNLTLSNSLSGGIVGILNAGQLTINNAFGSVKLSSSSNTGNEVGQWNGGMINLQSCTSYDSCKASDIETSFINVKNNADGQCGGSITSSSELIGSSGQYYFVPCQQNTRLTVDYNGTANYGNISVMNPDSGCIIQNIKISGKILIYGSQYMNISGVTTSNYNNVANVLIELNITVNSGTLDCVALFAVNGQPEYQQSVFLVFNNITIKSNFTSIYQYYNTPKLSAFITQSNGAIEFDNIQILGTQIYAYQALQMSLIICQIRAQTIMNGITVDAYRKSNSLNNFDLASEDLENMKVCSVNQNLQNEIMHNFKCDNLMDDNMKDATLFREFLSLDNQRLSFVKSVQTSQVSYSGSVAGQISSNVDISNVVIYTNTYIQNTGYYYHGAIFGCLFSGTTKINRTFVTGSSKVENSAIIGYGWTHYYVNLTIEFNFSNSNSAIFYKTTTQTYYQMINLLVNLKLQAEQTGALSYSVVSYLNIMNMAGIVIKDCQNCYLFSIADMQNEITAQVVDGTISISQDENQCPDPIDLS